MSKTEIIAELDRLNPNDLVEVREWLDRRLGDSVKFNGSLPARIRTPRLANQNQAAEFVKQVTELPGDATI